MLSLVPLLGDSLGQRTVEHAQNLSHVLERRRILDRLGTGLDKLDIEQVLDVAKIVLESRSWLDVQGYLLSLDKVHRGLGAKHSIFNNRFNAMVHAHILLPLRELFQSTRH